MRRRSLFAGAAAVLAAGGLGSISQATARSRADYFPNVPLRTHDGRTVRFYDDLLKDRTVTLNLMYTECGDICPGMTQNLAEVQKLLGDRVGRDIFMYSITLMPEHDTPEVLKAYAEIFDIGPGWTFLTGEPADVELLRRRLGFTDPDPLLDADLETHIGLVKYGIEKLDRWGGCPALSKPETIVQYINWMEG